MSSIPELMATVSEVLTTSEEMLEDDDTSDREVAMLVTAFLKILLTDLDKVLVEQGPTGVRPQLKAQPPQPAFERPSEHTKVERTKRPIVNKYEGKCVRCKGTVTQGAGFVLPTANPLKGKKWVTFCAADYAKENR